jgi:hypothetical protein
VLVFHKSFVTARLPRVKIQVLDNAFPEISISHYPLQPIASALTGMTVAKIQINDKTTKHFLHFLSNKPLQRIKTRKLNCKLT